MHIDHKTGDKMYIDFTGSKLQFHPIKGPERDAEVFLAILGCTRLTYVGVIESQHKEDLIKAPRECLTLFRRCARCDRSR